MYAEIIGMRKKEGTVRERGRVIERDTDRLDGERFEELHFTDDM